MIPSSTNLIAKRQASRLTPEEELSLSLELLSSLEDEPSDEDDDESSDEEEDSSEELDDESLDESSDEEEDAAGFFLPFLPALAAFPAASSGSLSLCSGRSSPGAKNRGRYCAQQ